MFNENRKCSKLSLANDRECKMPTDNGDTLAEPRQNWDCSRQCEGVL